MRIPISNISPEAAKLRITQWGHELGFDVVGFTPAELPAGANENLQLFLTQGYHGDMQWMQTHAERRGNPKSLWEDARSVIIFGHNYAPDYDPLELREQKENGLVSCYALGKDYHDIIKKKLRVLAGQIASELGAQVKLFVDTAPLMEKPLAAQSRLGWQGKHTCIVSREFGSWLFLGEILTDIELPYDAPVKDSCGQCSRCLDICPTQAFDAARQLDARKCISYLTIEHQGHIPQEYREKIGNRVYGCDDCLAVCPWNKFAKRSAEMSYHPSSESGLPVLPLEDMLKLDDGAFRKRFAGSPIKRIKRDRFIRNVLIAAGNSGQRNYISRIKELLEDTSPLVRAMAVWALKKLADENEFHATRLKYLPDETDIEVQAEWR